jgi:hypothetical protein
MILDEIGSILPLASAQNFFYALRSMHGEPADYPILKNATLVLSGVIDPDAIVSDSGASPFNYGERIYLPDFTAAQTRTLTGYLTGAGLYVSETAHERIFTWTGGQPYLTQKICALLERKYAGINQSTLEPALIDDVVTDHLLDPLRRDSHVAHLRKVLRTRRDIVIIVQQLLFGKEVSCEHALAYEMHLLGLVHRADNGCLMLSNGICRAIASTDGPSRNTQAMDNSHGVSTPGASKYEIHIHGPAQGVTIGDDARIQQHLTEHEPEHPQPRP